MEDKTNFTLEDIKKITLNPGDVLVAKIPEHSSKAHKKRICDIMKKVFKNNIVLITCDGEVEFSKIKLGKHPTSFSISGEVKQFSEISEEEHIASNPKEEAFPWKTYPEACPKCGEQMIENNKYVECGRLHCDYIKKK